MLIVVFIDEKDNLFYYNLISDNVKSCIIVIVFGV